MEIEERFWSKVDWDIRNPRCWPWQAYVNPGGYGLFVMWRGCTVRAHRLAYELEVGPIPEGLDLDHLCRNRACVNPDHLQPVTRRENILRGTGPAIGAARCAAITHCPQGHPYDTANTAMYRDKCRQCRECDRTRSRERQRRLRAEEKAQQ